MYLKDFKYDDKKLKEKNESFACAWTRRRFNMLESLFTRIHGQKIV